MSKRSREPANSLPQIIQEALRTVSQPRPLDTQTHLLKAPARLQTHERIIQLLEENAELLNAIQENFTLKRFRNCVQFQLRLHHNLRLLASWSDSALFRALAESAVAPSKPAAAEPPRPTPAPAQSQAPMRLLSPVSLQPNAASRTAVSSNTTTTDVGLQDLVAAIFPQISRRVAEASSSASILCAGDSNSGVGGNSNSAFRSMPPVPFSNVLPSEESILGAGNSVGLPSSALPADFLNLESSTDRIWNALLPTSRQG